MKQKKQHDVQLPPASAPAPSSRASRKKPSNYFKEHWTPAQINAGLRAGQLVRGILRANAKDPSEAYLTVPGLGCDLLVKGDRRQNRALDGDEVYLKVLGVESWFARGSRQPTPARNGRADESDSDGVDAPPAVTEEEGSGAGGEALSSSDDEEDDAAVQAQQAAALAKSIAAWAQQIQSRPNLRPTGAVVAILTPSPLRERVVGRLVSEGEGKPLLLMSVDARIPPIQIKPTSVAPAVRAAVEAGGREGDGNLYFGSMAAERPWAADSRRPWGEIRLAVGRAGDLPAERAAILLARGISDSQFPPAVLGGLPAEDWAVSAEERARRRDMTGARVFSIDPPTARDLDDALSIRALSYREAEDLTKSRRGSAAAIGFTGPEPALPEPPLPADRQLYEVGVHIADVTHFLKAGEPLDRFARRRATSTYLVDSVIPMLPHRLCQELCSLNPAVDRLAFSAFLLMDGEGRVYREWVEKCVINSCCRLAYADAQRVIEAYPGRPACSLEEAEALDHPTVSGGATWHDVACDILLLWTIGSKIRSERFASGALRLDQPKITFELDQDGSPLSYALYVTKEANWLVEEFMLLGNQTAARISAQAYPELAILRCHRAPEALSTALADLERCGIPLDAASNTALQTALHDLAQADKREGTRRFAFAIARLTKTMKLADYFCTGTHDPPTWAHWALAMPLYTHFTSPIRRYPDVLVHRVLNAVLGKEPVANLPALLLGADDATAAAAAAAAAARLSARLSGPAAAAAALSPLKAHALALGDLCTHMNACKKAARLAQEGSACLYLCDMIHRRGELTVDGVVLPLNGDRFIDLLLPSEGTDVRAYIEDLEGYAKGPDEKGTVRSDWDASSRTLWLYDAVAGREQVLRSLDSVRVTLRVRMTKSGWSMYGMIEGWPLSSVRKVPVRAGAPKGDRDRD